MPKPTEGKQTHQDMLQIHVPAQPRKRPRQTRSLLLVETLKKAGWDVRSSYVAGWPWRFAHCRLPRRCSMASFS